MKLNFSPVNLHCVGLILLLIMCCQLNCVQTSEISNSTDNNNNNATISTTKQLLFQLQQQQVGGSPILTEVRKRVKNLDLRSYFKTDQMLERYIEDAGFRVERAVSRLQRVAIWRRAARADNLLNWTPSETLSKNLPYECTGTTAEGNPVYYLPIGRWNFREVQEAGQSPEMFTYMVRIMEEAQNSTIGRVNPRTGEPVDQVVFIGDASGYNILKLLNLRATYSLLRAARAIDRYYPYVVKNWYFVKVPLSFRVLWSLARGLLRRRKTSAVNLYSSFGRQGTRALKHNVPLSGIPIKLGGYAVLTRTENN